MIVLDYVMHFASYRSGPASADTTDMIRLGDYFLSGVVLFICFAMASKVSTLWQPDGSNSASPEAREVIKARQTQQSSTPFAVRGLFSSDTFSLPVTTRDLVLVPMLIGVLSAVSCGLIFWVAVVLPFQVHVPVLLSILLLALTVTGSQACSWLLLAKSLFGCLLMPLTGFGPILGAVAWMNHVPDGLLDGASIALILASISVSLWAAPFARNSTTMAGSYNAAAIERAHSEKGKRKQKEVDDSKLPSPFQTQVWAESARKGYLALSFITGMSGIILLIVCLFYDATPSVRLGIGDIEIGTSTRLFLLCIPITLLFAGMFTANSPNVEAMNRVGKGSNSAMDPFSAIRPMGTAGFVIARLVGNVKTALVSSWILAVSMTLLLLAPARERQTTGTLGSVLATHASPSGLALSCIIVLSVPFLIWCSLSGDPFRAIFPKKFREYLSVGPIVAVVVVVSLVRESANSGSWDLSYILGLLTYIGIGLVCLKAMFAAAALVRIRRKGLLDSSVLIKIAVSWVGLGFFIVAAFHFLLPPDFVPLDALTVLVLLLLPANRILWQILALDASRHE